MSDRETPSNVEDLPAVGVPDTVLGLVFVVGGIVIFFVGRSLEGIGGMTIGPGTMPTIIGVFLALLGIVLAVQGLPELQRLLRGKAVVLRRKDLSWFPFVLLASLIAYILLFEIVGFVVLTFVYLLVMIRAGGGTILQGAAFSFFVTALIYYLFSYLLRVPLPGGILG